MSDVEPNARVRVPLVLRIVAYVLMAFTAVATVFLAPWLVFGLAVTIPVAWWATYGGRHQTSQSVPDLPYPHHTD